MTSASMRLLQTDKACSVLPAFSSVWTMTGVTMYVLTRYSMQLSLSQTSETSMGDTGSSSAPTQPSSSGTLLGLPGAFGQVWSATHPPAPAYTELKCDPSSHKINSRASPPNLH